MIQRVQTLFYIIAIGLTIAFFFVPFGYAPIMDAETGMGSVKALTGTEFIGLMVPGVAAIVLMLIAIFLYRNYPMQKLFTSLGAIALLATIGVVIYAIVSPYVDSNPDVTIATIWGGGGLFLVAALIADLAAYHYVSKDQRLVSRLDRIR